MRHIEAIETPTWLDLLERDSAIRKLQQEIEELHAYYGERMITPDHVRSLHRNVRVYEAVIDAQLENPWSAKERKVGKKVSLRVQIDRAARAKQPLYPSSLQEGILFESYTTAGWQIKRTGTKSTYEEWLVQFPAIAP